MAGVCNDGNGRRRIQFVGSDGKRKAVLLGTDADPGQRQRADLNCGGTAEGRDVQLLLDRLTAQ